MVNGGLPSAEQPQDQVAKAAENRMLTAIDVPRTAVWTDPRAASRSGGDKDNPNIERSGKGLEISRMYVSSNIPPQDIALIFQRF